MNTYLICCFILLGILAVVCVAAYIEHKRNQTKIVELEMEITKFRNYIRYQQKQIDGLREHNGNLYDENLGLKSTMVLKNIPNFDQNW